MGLDQSGGGYRGGAAGFQRKLKYPTMDTDTIPAACLVLWTNYSGGLEGACRLCLSMFLLMNICHGDCGSGGRGTCPMNGRSAVQIPVIHRVLLARHLTLITPSGAGSTLVAAAPTGVGTAEWRPL